MTDQNLPPAGQPPQFGATGGLPPADIFSILGLTDLPDNEKMMLLQKIEKIIQEQVIHLIVTQLSDDQCKELNEKMDKGMNQWEVIEFLRTKIPNLDEQIRKLVFDFKDDLIAEVDDIKKSLASGKTPSPNPVTDRFKKGYIPTSPAQPQTPSQAQPTSASPNIPPEIFTQIQQLDQAIQQASQTQNFDQMMQLMNQRKAIKDQWGIH